MIGIIVAAVLKTLVISFVFVFGLGATLSWVERRQSALIQDRYGPRRANLGPFKLFGLFHIIADGLKVFTKEDFVPGGGNPIMHFVGPILALAPPLLVWVVIPVGPTETFLISGVSTGILVFFAIAGLSVYGMVMGGWASNNKFSLMGALRGSAQMISYEVTLGLTVVGIFMVYGSLELQEIVVAQGDLLFGFLPKWGIVTQPLGFVLFVIAAQVENKRAPFDVVEADSELVSGYFTEYSSFRFAGFYMSEFLQIVVIAGLLVTLFLGGWQIPWYTPAVSTWWTVLLQVGAFVTKVVFVCLGLNMIRWTLPRMRYDQIMHMGWTYLLPLSLFNIMATGLVLYLAA